MKRNLALSILFLSIMASAGWAKAKPAQQQKAADAKESQTTSSKGGEQSAAGDELNTVLAMMNKASATFKSAQGDFESTDYQKLVDDKFTQQGHIYFRHAKDGVKDGVDVAFDLEGKAPKQVVYQKGVLRVYEKNIAQITERHVGNNRSDVDAFLSLGFGASGNDLVRDYEVKMLGWETISGTKTAKLELAAKNTKIRQTYPKILIWIDPEKDILVQQQFFENSGDYRLVHYSNMKLNEKISDDKFQIKTSGKVTTVQAQ